MVKTPPYQALTMVEGVALGANFHASAAPRNVSRTAKIYGSGMIFSNRKTNVEVIRPSSVCSASWDASTMSIMFAPDMPQFRPLPVRGIVDGRCLAEPEPCMKFDS